MYTDYRPRLRRRRRFNRRRIDVEVAFSYIDEHRSRSSLQDRIGRRRKRKRRYDDFVTCLAVRDGADAMDEQRNVQCCRAAVYCDGMAHANIRRKRLFEFRDAGALRQSPGGECFAHGILFVSSDCRVSQSNAGANFGQVQLSLTQAF